MSYPKLHLPLKTLQSLFEKQLCVELASKVCVVSVEKPALPSKEVMHAVGAELGSRVRGGGEPGSRVRRGAELSACG